jgi:hypothetical protein
VPFLIIGYVVSQLVGDVLGDVGTVLQFFVLAIAFTGAAVSATERGLRREQPLSTVLRQPTVEAVSSDTGSRVSRT